MKARNMDNDPISSRYFLLPSRDPNSNETPREYTERISQNISIQIDMQINSISASTDPSSEKDRIDKISDIAHDLISFTKQLSHTPALFILFRMVNHPKFKNLPARDILLAQIHLENLHRSPLNTEPCTLETILKFHNSDRQDVEDFLTNPTRLIIWMNKASALEISRLIRKFYSEESQHLAKLKTLAKAEHTQSNPGKAFLCYVLIMQRALNISEIKAFAEAANKLHAEEKNDAANLLPSLKVRAISSAENIKNANNHFIHCHLLELESCDFSKMALEGAFLNQAKLDGSRFTDCIMTETQLQSASLVKCDFTNAFLENINFCGADLSAAILAQADLRAANLTNANLSNANLFRANLSKANLHNANLDSAIFFSPTTFKYKETLNDELDRLTAMLRGHQFEDLLNKAILNNFLKHTLELEVPAATTVKILELAYTHPLFSTHRTYDLPLAAVNMASKSAEYALARFWYKKPVTDIKTAYETPAQKAIYQEWLARTSHESRPPQPAFSPEPPK